VLANLAALFLVACETRVDVAPPKPDIQVGALEADRPTLISLGFYLPITRGADYWDAVALLHYREHGTTAWSTGLPLMPVRPEFADIRREPSFAGSLFGLKENTTYDVKVEIANARGGPTVRSIVASTRGYPRSAPREPRPVDVSTTDDLREALSKARPGDVITLAPGTYVGDFVVARGVKGTPDNPIFVRGRDRDTVILKGGTSHGFQIFGDFVTLEDMTIEAGGSGIGVLARDSEGTVIRRTWITNVDQGIILTHGTNRNFTIYNNVLGGRNRWPTIDRSTWNDEGIAVSGEGHAIFHNTLYGFGDALGLSRFGDIANRSIDFYGNDVLWTGDDGIELDDGERNVRAFENRVTNSATLISVQHNNDTGGPVYAFRNVGLNQARMPFKLNDSPSGFYLLQNTSVKTQGADDWLWVQYNNGPVQNFAINNNILVSLSPYSRGVAFQAPMDEADFDYNGYHPTGSGQPHEPHGVALEQDPFATPISLGPDYTTFAVAQSPGLKADSNAIDAGAILPNINDSYTGAAPDLGALERGAPVPQYGADWWPAKFAPASGHLDPTYWSVAAAFRTAGVDARSF
jgi:hypothetical protein